MGDVRPVDWHLGERITLANARSALYAMVPSFVPHALHRDHELADRLYDGALFVLAGETRRPVLGRAGRALVAKYDGWVP